MGYKDMFFEREFLSLGILEVLKLSQGNIDICNKGRAWNAISFRFRSDTVLKTAGKEHRVFDNYVSIVPAGLIPKSISLFTDLTAE